MICIINGVKRSFAARRAGALNVARYPRATTEANRERIVVEAARLLRERGLDGVGVADLMGAAGLTHGGFYRHFASKQDLAVEAVELLFHEASEQWRDAADRARAAGRSGVEGILDGYLSDEHRDAVHAGCAIAALGPDLARLPDELRRRVADGVQGMVSVLAAELPGDPDTARDRAAALFGAMIGALVLGRLGVPSAEPARAAAALIAQWAPRGARRLGRSRSE